MKTTWKDIAPVPTSQEFLDVVLSRTQRRLPTQIRSGFKISRIRGFYTRKVKFTQETFTEKLSAILEGFPRLQDIHPFHKDLLNTLYDADHFKIALGQLSTAKHLIETVSRDYVRLLKYAPSLYQCKQLKRAALGRMATICKRLKDSLIYLEQVRQHLGRLPSIDPNTRTLLICGYPNVGKSSFLRSVTRADVDVQPYAFTTKSLFVGHFDYKYLRFQAIDTPGILDHPLEEMNTIEMQSITAIAHLRSAILYFMDLSEQCGYSVTAQLQLFRSIKPLFANKLVFIVINKIDLFKPSDLDPETKGQLDAVLKSGDVELLQLSCTTTEGVTEVKNAACERLIADRVAQKLKAGTSTSGAVGGRLGDVLTRIHVAQPLGGVVREPYIPDAIKTLQKFSKDDPSRPRLARDIEEENGGPGVYNVNLRQDYRLRDDDWKEDRIPEVLDGKNVYDFVDPDIASKLAALESEEERLEASGFYDDDEDLEDAHESDIRMKADLIRKKREEIRNEARMRKSLKNRAMIPRAKALKKLSVMEDSLDRLGYDTTSISVRTRSRSRGRPLERSRTGTEDIHGDAMDVDMATSNGDEPRMKSRARSQSNRREDGVKSVAAREKAQRLMKLGQQRMNRAGRQGEADRHTTAALPKHLFSGKRGMGKTQRRYDDCPAKMQIIVNILGSTTADQEDFLVIDVNPDTTIASLKQRIEFQSAIAPANQIIQYNGSMLLDDNKTMEQCQVTTDAMVGVQVVNPKPNANEGAGPSRSAVTQAGQRQPMQAVPTDAEYYRQQYLHNPQALTNLTSRFPELANVINDPARWRELWTEVKKRQEELQAQRDRDMALDEADPFDMEAQKRIEELIRLKQVEDNLEQTREYHPEEVNGQKLKAFVDSGAQATIMSPECAERCGIMRLLDTRWAGIARGVGTAKILGRVHSAPIKIGSSFLPSSFTVMEGKDVDLLLGLDMLKRFQACIDLNKGVLRLHGDEVPFLGEADIPKSEWDRQAEPTVDGPGGGKIGAISGTVKEPGVGKAAEAASSSSAQQAPVAAPSPPFPEADIATLMDMGMGRSEAIQALTLAGGNVQAAAGLLF
ncbi:MAG: hypothetical protein Q9163_004554 [Psora crenata]